MTDLVSQLVGALEAATTELESHQGNPYCNLYDLPEFKAAIAQARAALTAAKAGGWVLPEGKRVIVVDDSFEQLIYWVDRTVSKGNANSDIQEAYEAWAGWDTWPLPTPPKEQA